MTRLHIAMGWLGLALSLAGCKRMSTDAKEQFAKTHSCPEDRVTIKERKDISPVTLLGPKETNPPTPPDDVKKDPGCLAKWEADRKAEREQLERGYRGYTIFEASGCGVTTLMSCTHGEQMSSGGNSTTVVMCQEKPLP